MTETPLLVNKLPYIYPFSVGLDFVGFKREIYLPKSFLGGSHLQKRNFIQAVFEEVRPKLGRGQTGASKLSTES